MDHDAPQGTHMEAAFLAHMHMYLYTPEHYANDIEIATRPPRHHVTAHRR
jgi:hypothetical protein